MLSEHCLGFRYLVEGTGKSHLFCCRVLSPLSIHVSAKNTKTKKKTDALWFACVAIFDVQSFFFLSLFFATDLAPRGPGLHVDFTHGTRIQLEVVASRGSKKKMKSAF